MSSLPNLQPALKLYSSDKVRDRAQGSEQIREIFSNKENLQIFQDTASRDGGAGWIAFFQCLFQVVVVEKKGVLKSAGSAQADRRLSEAISLVRWMTERSIHYLSRKPFQTIFNHLLHLLVHSRHIFPPAALDYAKAIRALISYPPHLENLDVGSWRCLMGVCLGAVLGEGISLDDVWEDGMDVDELEDESGEIDEKPFIRKGGGVGGMISQSTNELVSLIPILLSSTASPLLSPLPDNETDYTYKPSYSLHLINRFVKFLNLHPTETSAHLPMLRSLNVVLGGLELNGRGDFVEGGKKVWGRLVELWGSRNKGLRELVVVGLRMIMPWIGGVGKGGKVEDEIREGMERLMEGMVKDSGVRWGAVPLDLGCLRLRLEEGEGMKSNRGPYTTRAFCPGFDFTHEAALNWAIYELYAEVCYTLYATFADRRAVASASTPGTPTAKRRKVNDPLTSLIRNLEMGTSSSRLIALQVLLFLVNRHWEDLHGEARKDIRRILIELLDDDDAAVQNWALLGLAFLATFPQDVKQDTMVADTSSANLSQRHTEEHDWNRVWTYAIRKTSLAATSRAACHTANAILTYGILPISSTIGDIDNALRTVEIQGPPYPHESVCALLTSMLRAARTDVRLYASKLEDQVIAWLARWNALEGTRGKGRMDATTPRDILELMNEACRFKHVPMATISVEEVLPDCAIVDRVLEEFRLAPIRQWLLHELIVDPPTPERNHSKKVENGVASLGFLDGVPKRICRILMDNLTAFVEDWSILSTNEGNRKGNGNKKSESPPDRVRRTLDVVVLSLSFQASLELNSVQPDSSVIQQCLQLLRLVRSSLTSPAYNTTALHLIWRGLHPLVSWANRRYEIWPIMLRPDIQSGIRQDLLKPSSYGLYSEGGAEGEEDEGAETEGLLMVLWRLQDVGSALKDLCDDALRLIERGAPQSANLSNTQLPTQAAIEDDDFGEIRNADTDAMPLSKEALECQRTTLSLGDTLVRFRLRTPMLVSPIRLASKDSALINTFLTADGPRFAQIGTIICDAIGDGLLRLSADAVDLILETIEEMLSSYAYSKDENLLCVVLSFVTCSLPVWLSAENGGGNGDIGSRSLDIIRVLVDRSSRGILASWKVRLGLIAFCDEYLDYDPPMAVWRQFLVDVGMDVRDNENDIKPIKLVTTSLRDLDIRVRMRAATSSAGIFYLTSIHTSDFLSFYTSIVNAEARTAEHWDSIVTDILFKLNCCVTSAHLRATAIYHLYELATAGTKCHGHLQSGLETAAKRLGLDGIGELFMPYSPVIVKSMISTGQPPMRIPHRLHGYPTRKAQASALLEYTGATILAAAVGEAAFPRVDSLRGARAEFAGLCEAAGVDLGEAMIHHLTGAAAVVLGCKVDEMIDVPISHEEALGALLSLPGLPTADIGLGLLTESADAVIAHLFTSVDSAATIGEILSLLPKAAGAVFEEISTTDDELVITTPALQPCAGLKDVLSAYKYILKRFTTISISKMVFGAVSRLFYLVNDAFLVCEQLRHLKSITILAALHAKEFGNPTVLGMFLRESIELISKIGTFDPAFSMIRWGFERVLQVKAIIGIEDMIGQLGIARESLAQQGGLCEGKGDDLEGWIAQQLPRWIRVEAMAGALDAGKVFWPERLSRHLTGWPEPSFGQLTDMVRVTTKGSLAICQRMVKAVRAGDPTVDLSAFREDTFWHLKKAMGTGSEEDEGMEAFLDLLFYANGNIHAPIITATVELVHDPDLAALKVAAGTGSRSSSSADRSIVPVMAAITEKIVRITTDADFRLRERAFKVLRGIIPAVDNIRSTKMLKPLTLDLLPLLSASSLPKYVKTAQDSLRVLDNPGDREEWVRKGRDYRIWTAAFGHLLCTTAKDQTGFYTAILPLLQPDSTPPPGILPLLVQSSLTLLDPKVPLVDDTKRHIRTLTSYFTRLLEDKSTSLEVVKAIIHIMVYLRHYLPPYRIDSLGYENWLSVEPMLLSRMSAKCGEYNTALMFLELAGPGRVGKPGVELTNEHVQDVMYEIYSNVEDPDGFYGIKTRDTSKALSRQLQHEGEHWRSLGLNSAAVQGRASTSIVPAMRDLHHLGFDRMASAVFGSLQTTCPTGSKQLASDPLFFELAWRTGDWDLPTSSGLQAESGELFYTVLRAVHRERDFKAARKVVRNAIGIEVGRLRESGLERVAQIKERTGRLLCLREVDNWLKADTQRSLQGGKGKDDMLRMFSDLDNSFSFGNAENILATRRSLITAAKEREGRNTFGDLSTPAMDTLIILEKKCLLRLGEMARQDGNLQASINAITAVKELEGSETASVEALDEFGHVLWAMQEHSLALRDAEQQVKDFRKSKGGNQKRLAVLLGRIATWTATAKLRAADGIKQTFEEALSLSKSMALSTIEQARCCHDYAVFADAHQLELSRSPELERLRSATRQNNRSIASSTSSKKRQSTSKSATNHEVDFQEDQLARQKMEDTQAAYVKIALKMYAAALSMSNEHDDSVTRMCALWLAQGKNHSEFEVSMSKERKEEVDQESARRENICEDFAGPVAKIPSYKFIFLGPQLAARLDKHREAFNGSLNDLILRLSRQHPFHILYQIIPLAGGAVSVPAKSRRASDIKADDSDNGAIGRAEAADHILKALSADSGNVMAKIAAQQMKLFAEAATSWSLSRDPLEDSATSDKPLQMPQNCLLRGLINLRIPVPTCPPAVDLTGKYERVATLRQYRNAYTILGGIHKPKRMAVFDSLKQQHIQIFKGDDEVRQDAVMEQVFEMSNKLLSRDRKTKARDLRFRTYVVIPLAKKTGVLEFVGDSQGIGDWLKPSHSRYGKLHDDHSADSFRKALKPLQEDESTWPELKGEYERLMTKFHPVMRYFFHEKHRDAMAWFGMRLNYARSVAVTSVVGWVLGIGDRHCSNILIDTKSGELVHIDFGIVFEEGRRLRIPEKVPFRLTNDIVDGLGITGVDGTFRRCSEHTLRVLRESSELIMTVLEVFKHDPLYAWTGDPDKLQRAQGGGRIHDLAMATGQEKADRILSRIRQKLRGDLSVEYTVNQLIMEARDTESLAGIFTGWQAWF